MILEMSQISEKLIINDNSLIMAIIAINMTVIGLTSLADKKTVIGIDYGDFLINKFKILGVRIYHLLIIFASINVISLFIIFIDQPIVNAISFGLLILSLIFAIVYFFAFILIENPLIVEQIYIEELLGLYKDSKDIDHFDIDRMVGMASGTRTERKMSTNIIDYFNKYNSTTKKVFIEIFGPKSIIYSQDKKFKVIRKKLFKTEGYKYRTCCKNNAVDISHEAFQVFRYVENQEKWVFDILMICGGSNEGDDDYECTKAYKLKLYNFARMMAHINEFGICDNLFKHRFLFNFKKYWYSAVDIKNYYKAVNIEEIRALEHTIIELLFAYIIKSIKMKKSNEFIVTVKEILIEVNGGEKYKGVLTVQNIFEAIAKLAMEKECDELKFILQEAINESVRSKKNILDIKKLKESIEEFKVKKVIEKSSQKDFDIELFKFSKELEVNK